MTHPSLRTIGISAVVGGSVTTALLAGAAAAGADAFTRLPNGTASGDGIRIVRSEESARVSPSMAANGTSRTTWVSGQITLYAPHLKPSKAGPSAGAAGESELPGSNGTATNGAAATLSTGYIVGCQVNVKGLQGGLSGSLTPTAPSVSGTLSVPLAAGEVKFVPLGTKNIEKPGTYHLGYDDAQIDVQDCAGYAQARAFTTIETTGEVHQKVNLYGKPFSIG
ncbi:MspA family porin [Gordonia westfalica]|uniref:MspA family porin n=1 Tax=Gordonia westfalica TaxID=158898 RepID=A0ABU2GUV3_9ACTN|nr:MspA family porin [Gordonia westfalica]MDS1115248.1 MspA family porin [Gordonia westfalica]